MSDGLDYYLDPRIEFYLHGDLKGDLPGRRVIEHDGYYIHPHCVIECCGVWGPFKDREAAREWARLHLANAGPESHWTAGTKPPQPPRRQVRRKGP